MDWTARIRRAFVTADQVPAADVLEELAAHASAMYESARAGGRSPEEADRLVADQITRWCAEAGRLYRLPCRQLSPPPPAGLTSWIVGVSQDVRFAARLLRRQPKHALVTIATLALGIGATTVLFSVSYGVLMRPLPWPNADRIVVAKETRGGSPPRFGAFTNTVFAAWRGHATTIDEIAAWTPSRVTLTGTAIPERIAIMAATASLFRVLGVQPLLGTVFAERDDTSPVIVLSERLWRERYAGNRGILGQTIRLEGKACTVIGILPDSMAFPDRQTLAFVPLPVPPATATSLTMFNVVARLRPGMTPAQAAGEGTARGRLVTDTGMATIAIFGNGGPVEVAVQPLRDALTGTVRRPLIVLLIAVGLLLVTATANVASLQLARATARRREMAIRVALGAGSARLARQLLVEALILGLAGGVVGLALTRALHASLTSVLPADFPRADSLELDLPIFAFASLASLGVSIVVGLLPAFSTRRLDPVEALSEDGAAPVGGGLRARVARSRTAIMIAQVAIACLLLVAASLVCRSFVGMLMADRGFDLQDVWAARVSLPETMFPAQERRFALINDALARLQSTPGVADAAFTSELPLMAGGSTSAFDLHSRGGELVHVQASPRIVSPRYFATLRIATIAGRVFASTDTESSPAVVVVNRSFARRYLGGSPLGARVPVIAYAPPDKAPVEATVIGVVDDARYVTYGVTSQPELFFSYRQMAGRLPVQTVTILARASTPAAASIALRSTVREVDDRLVAERVEPLEERLLTTLAQPRLYALLLGGFAAVAVLIAAVGLFGLLSYTVSLRSRELAIRAAIGARPADIVRLIVRQGLLVLVPGLAAGLLASAWTTRLLASHLYGIAPHDPVTFVLVPLGLLAVGMASCLTAARRAVDLDTLRVLRGS